MRTERCKSGQAKVCHPLAWPSALPPATLEIACSRSVHACPAMVQVEWHIGERWKHDQDIKAEKQAIMKKKAWQPLPC
jgi:hypothetical protein